LRDLDRLRPLRDKAEQEGDAGESDRLDGEIEALEEAVGGNGQAAQTGERARGNVSKAIAALRLTLSKGEQAERDFCHHIEQFVSTGYECMYNQPGQIWA